MTKIKIFNDPVHGFIEVPRGIILDVIEHPYFQRLRRIGQFGLTNLVYMGAQHTRFSHVLGAYHLVTQALNVLKSKEIEISNIEYEATQLAILLHDIGHGPFSHALEQELVFQTHHEELSLALMSELNAKFSGALTLAIQIFEDKYYRPFFHQLISSQLDMDRMDYLMRDSFFTGVQEGIVGTDRIIKTLNIANEKLVVEEKGIYSIEKFIVARRLMYWQVYLHKTALSAELMLINCIRRARYLVNSGIDIWTNEALNHFLMLNRPKDSKLSSETIQYFVSMDDTDIRYAIKMWQKENDAILSNLCKRILERNLFKLKFSNQPIKEDEIELIYNNYIKKFGYNDNDKNWLIISGSVSNLAYLKTKNEPILILFKDGKLKDVLDASDIPNFEALSNPVKKYYLCYAN